MGVKGWAVTDRLLNVALIFTSCIISFAQV